MQRFADLFMSRTTRRQIGYTIFSPFFELAKSFAPGTKSALFSVRDPQPELRDVGYTAFRVFASVVWRLSQKLLPERIARSLVQLRLLDAEYRKTYLALWLSRRSRRRRSSRGNRLNGLRRVTFVCRANRIRSPLAAALLASELRCNGAAEFCVQSAGTSASSEGEYDPRVREAARTMGLALSGAPQAVTPNLVAGSDLLVVMDHMVEAELLTQFPAAMAKTVLLGDLACHIRSTGPEILDPDRSPESQFDRFILDLARSVRQMARLIS
jgi:protein-tyrosine-phosphatase